MHSLIPISGAIFQGIVLSWIRKLEQSGCSCSTDWRRDFIKYYSVAALALSILLLVQPRFVKQYLRNLMFVIPFYVAYIYAILTYVPALWRHDCDCATKGDWRDDFIFWWIGIGLLFQVLVLIQMYH